MDLAIRILEIGFNHKRRRITRFTRRRVIRARVSAFREDVRDRTICVDDLFDEFCEARVHKIGNHADAFGFSGVEGFGRVARHVLLEHGFDVAGLFGVGGEDGLAS